MIEVFWIYKKLDKIDYHLWIFLVGLPLSHQLMHQYESLWDYFDKKKKQLKLGVGKVGALICKKLFSDQHEIKRGCPYEADC